MEGRFLLSIAAGDGAVAFALKAIKSRRVSIAWLSASATLLIISIVTGLSPMFLEATRDSFALMVSAAIWHAFLAWFVYWAISIRFSARDKVMFGTIASSSVYFTDEDLMIFDQFRPEGVRVPLASMAKTDCTILGDMRVMNGYDAAGEKLFQIVDPVIDSGNQCAFEALEQYVTNRD